VSALTLLIGRQEGHPACKKTEWWSAGVVVCLERYADLHMAQLMPLPVSLSCFSKIRIVCVCVGVGVCVGVCVCVWEGHLRVDLFCDPVSPPAIMCVHNFSMAWGRWSVGFVTQWSQV